MNKNYVKGRAFEYEIMATFKSWGCLVTRSAGSHGEWDVTAAATDLDTINQVRDMLDRLPHYSVVGFLGTAVEWSTGKTIYLTTIQGHYTNNMVILVQCKVKAPKKK